MSQAIDFNAEISLMLSSGLINEHFANYLKGLAKQGLDESLWQEALDDARLATELGIDSQKDFLIFFYIDHFVDEIAEELFGIQLDQETMDELKRYMFSLKDSIDYSNLVSYRAAILKWINEHKDKVKTAYPNTGLSFKPVGVYNLENWISLAKQIGIQILNGFPRDMALKRAANSLNIPEKYDFLVWYKFHSSGEYDKYNVNDKIKKLDRELRMDMALKNKYAADDKFYYVPKLLSRPVEERIPETEPVVPERPEYSEQYALDFETARNKLMSRIFAIDKLLEKYRRVLKQDQIDDIETALGDLRRKIRKLRLASTIKDSLIKTANILNNLEFHDGAHELIVIAAESDTPVQPGETKVITKEAPPIPEGARDGTLDSVVNRLTAISTILKNRDIIRSLAEIDLMLHKLRMASFFSEVQEAQAKLIDAFGYASNKIEDLLPKLRGGLQKQPEIVSEHPPEDTATPDQKELGKEVDEMSKGLKDKAKPTPPPAPALEAPAKPEPPAPKPVEAPPGPPKGI